MSNNRKIIFITGAFVSHNCWDNWIDYFAERGFDPIAPAWPFKDAPPKVLRERQPYDTELATLTLDELIDHYAGIAAKLAEKPIIIGHSLGGLIAQILINRNLGSAAVAIHPVPPQGVFPYEFTFLRATWKLLGIFSSVRKTYLVNFKDFCRTFLNGLPEYLLAAEYEKYAIPESRTVARGGLTKAAAVDFNKERAPLLITAGSRDNLIPVHLINRNYKRYKNSDSITDYKEFPQSNHGLLTGPFWREEADFILEWINVVSR